MSDYFSGWVLVGARTSPTNAATSAPADSGVSKQVAFGSPALPGYSPNQLIAFRADQYRAAVLDGGEFQEEYLVWAANTGSILTVEDPSWVVTTGTGALTSGSLSVLDVNRASGEVADGSPRIVVTDDGGRDIAGVLSLVFVRGDDSAQTRHTFVSGTDFDFSPSGIVELLPTANVLAATTPVDPTAPGVSKERGDRVVGASYYLAETRFWWTKNDRYATRFAWNAAKSKWLPLRGGSVKNLGPLSSDAGSDYRLSPRPSTPVGSYLPGSDAGDAYATVRLGALPNATSYPVVERASGDFTGVLVVPDDLANASYDFASVSPPLAGVASVATGKVTWNPAFVSAYAGLTVWYSPAVYEEKSSGVVAELLSAKTEPLFLAPVPGPGERPVIRLGNREPLTVIACDTEAQLLALSAINEGEVAFALSTGRIRLSPADITKADPGTRAVPNVGFDKLWLGAVVRYDGVTGNPYPQPLRGPRLLVDGAGNPVTSFDPSGEVFIPDSDGLLGVGGSGIVNLPDATGNVPDGSLPVSPRPGESGVVRALSSGLGDVVLFTRGRAVETIRTVAFEDELPANPYRVSGSTAYVALEKRGALGSKVLFGSAVGKQLKGKPLYFKQAEFVPSGYAVQARLISRVRDTFALDGTESLLFRIGGVDVTWLASSLGAGIYKASQIAASLDAAITSATAPGSAYTLSGRVVISDDDSVTGSVAVGFSTPSGSRALGFLPGWLASPPGDTSAADVNWLPDYGGEFGFYRSPRNLDLSQDVPDYRDTYRLSERVLAESVQETPFQFLDYPPREDLAGYDEGVFFALSSAGAPGAAPTFGKTLEPWGDVRYLFEQSKFAWLGQRSFQGQVESPLASINLGASGVYEETFLAPLGGYFRISSTGGPFVYREPGDGLYLANGGATGEAFLIDRVGPVRFLGYRGAFSSGSSLFNDSSAPFGAVAVGDLLQVLSGDASGYYLVEKVKSPTQLQVSPNFPVGDGGQVQSYRIREGVSPDTINPAVLADVVYEPFSPLPVEPFEIRVLTKLGVAGTALANADSSKSIERGRPIFARFAQTGSDLPFAVLGSSVLGSLANDVLVVPATGARFTTGSFSVLVGTVEFINGTDLVPVPAFSPDPGTDIEYLDGTSLTPGLLRFGSSVFANLGGASVTYVEKGLPPASLASGQSELDPNTGTVYLSQADLTTYAGEPVYYVEQLSCEGTTDMTVNPVLGAFTFLANPIREGQLVEATYFRAVPNTGELYLDSAGHPVRVKEFLPLYVRAEVATRVSSQVYSFNPTGRTVDQLVSPVVYEDALQHTYGVPPTCSVDFSTNRISFVNQVPSTAKVTISYAVYEAFGGETAYTASIPPVWRPPLRIEAGQTQFALGGDRTSDLEVGRLFRLGAFATYLRAFTYDGAQDATLVTVFPAPRFAAGSLDTGSNALSLLTDRPIVSVVDPFGAAPTPVPGDVDGGFFAELTTAFGLAQTPRFEPVTKNQIEIKFDGDLTRYAVVGHLIELLGYPFLIVKADLSGDGRVTTVTLGSPFPTAFAWSASLPNNAVRISVRPVYPEGAASFVGKGKYLPEEGVEVVLYGEKDSSGNELPGRVLAPGADYNLNPSNGSISFLQPRQSGIGALQSLEFYRTDTVSIAPFAYRGQVQYPRAAASFGYLEAPSTKNGRAGGILQATYTFESPDAFYARAVPFQDFSGEVSLELQKAATAQEPSFGPTISSGASKDPSSKGRVGLVSERMNLVDRDRVARAFLGFYNAVVSAFEQIEETLDGQLIGERDGKLRLRFGKGDPWTPPGYEDEITGEINPRVLWFGAFDAARRGLPVIRLLRTDPITDPLQTVLDANGRPQGPVQDSASFGRLLDFQATLIQNDIDDVVLVSRGRVERTLAGFIWFKVRAFGNYADLSQASPYSRVFPERTTAFTTTAPGLDFDETTGAPGVYSAGKFGFDPLGFLYGFPFSVRSTTGTAIGTLENPVLGTVQNVLGVAARDRLARARIWAYSSTGFPDVDPASAGLPSFIATPLPLVDFPLLSDTGLPDTAQLASQSLTPTPTGLNDLLTGDPDLHTPPFEVGDQLALGVPEGSFTQLGDSGTSFPVGVPPVTRYGGVFVNSVLSGCIITLADESGAVIANPARLVALSGPAAGTPIDPRRGDTLFVVPRTGENLVVSDPPTIAEVQALSAALPEYRTGTDLNFNSRTGELIDATLPSFADPTPFGLKEITGQRPPAPLSTLEARVSFQNGERLPARIPALDGGKRLDSGDYSLPYYGSPTSELELLGTAASALIDLTRTDSPDPPPVTPPTVAPAYVTEAVYPDETLGADGGVKLNIDPSALLTSEDLLRGTSSGAYPPPPGHAGVGDLNQFDLVFIQEGTGTPGPAGFPAGATGIHTVGGLTIPGAPALSQIEPPRFTSPMSENTPIDYVIQNGQAWVDYPAYASGVVVRETVVGPLVTTEFIIGSIPAGNIVFDDGAGGGVLPAPVGGWNDVIGWAGKGTLFAFSIIDKTTGSYPFSTILNKTGGGSGPGTSVLAGVFDVNIGGPPVPVNASGFYFLTDRVVVVTAAPWFDFTPYGSVTPAPGVTETSGFHDFAVSALADNGYTASIDVDRLTWRDHIDFRSALPRGFTHPAGAPGASMECGLTVLSHDATVYNPAPTTVGVTFNANTYINAALPFTFPARSWIAPSVNGVGTFTPAPSPGGLGAIRVSGFEGRGNVPIEATGITFSAAASSRQSKTGPIYNGFSIVSQIPGTGEYQFVQDNYFVLAGSPFAGSVAEIQPGDIAVVKGTVDPAVAPPGTNVSNGKVGTYLVRAAVAETPATLPGHRLDLTASVGSAGAWLDFVFPTVIEVDPGGVYLEASSLLPLAPLSDVAGAPVVAPFAFPASGRVYVLVNESDVTVAGSAVSAAYASLDGPNNRFLTLSGFQDGVGGAITLAQFVAAATVGKKLSGMTVVPVAPSGDGVPANLPGVTIPVPFFPLVNSYYFGFRAVTVSYNGGAPSTFDAGLGTIVGVAPVPGELGVYQKTTQLSTGFLPLGAPVYREIPGALDLSGFPWAALHGVGPACLFPGDSFGLQYHAQAGLFVEPSFPMSGNDLAAPRVNVVDAANSLTTSEIGTRNYTSYATTLPAPGVSFFEIAQIEVRRIRRFHDLLDFAAGALRNLRFVYEIRRGIVASLTTSGSASSLVAEPVDTARVPSPLPGGTATQLGNFTVPLLNVNGGDTVRFLDADGLPFAEMDVLSVETDGFTLTLSRKALAAVVPGTRFEVYLRKAPVPHEQSCEELLDLATDVRVLDREANLVTQQGGKVDYIPNANLQVAYNQSINKLTDTSGSINFVKAGVQVGDLLVIDPAGKLRGPTGAPSPSEYGRQPFGDQSVIDRGPGAPYNPGGPSQLDDNRGYYRIKTVNVTQLEVEALGGELASMRPDPDVVYDASYAVYPTVHGSSLSGAGNDGREGQIDLRPTAFCNGSNSFRGNWFSVAPFSYRVIRPTPFLSETALELILSTRERLLSWMEELRTLFESGKSGTYFVFQRDQHITDLGDPTDPLLGLGVLFDAYIATIAGLVDVSPFTNTSDALSILDRRFWGLDLRLDTLTPPYSPVPAPPYADFANDTGRPVLPDRIEEVLNQSDNLRDARWSWLTLRTDRVSGTLEAIRRFDRELSRRIAEQKRLLTAVKGTKVQ